MNFSPQWLGWMVSFACLANMGVVEHSVGNVDDAPTTLAGTEALQTTSDIASDLVDGVDRFLLRQLNNSVETRLNQWPRPNQPIAAGANAAADYEKAIEPMRAKLMACLGMVDKRRAATGFQIESKLIKDQGKPVIREWQVQTDVYNLYRVHWGVLEGVDASGLMVVPNDEVRFCAVVIPDAEYVPNGLRGLDQRTISIAQSLARRGGLVVVPSVIRRHEEARNGRSVLTDQEYLYRSAFVLGRHPLGYQVAETQAAIDNLKLLYGDKPLCVAGWGEGGWIALHAAAVDPRIDVACVSGHFGPREKVWQEPIHRNVHGLLRWLGDAQLAALIAPRTLIVDTTPGPEVHIHGKGGAPGVLAGPTLEEATDEYRRAQQMLALWNLAECVQLHSPNRLLAQVDPFDKLMDACLEALHLDPKLGQLGTPTFWSVSKPNIDDRLETFTKWERFQQLLLDRIDQDRDAYWKSLDTKSPEAFQTTVEPYRDAFREEVIGRWDIPLEAPKPRTRLIYEREKWLGYEVVLDVFDGVIAYGVLLVPKNMAANERRPCVVFQHGLEGRPADTIVGDHPAYHDVSARLADEGYVVFAPQNLYLFGDRFRTLQRKSNPLGRTLFSTIIAQHQQIVHWLQSRPEVEPSKIAFYGLSYGGKSAMRIPALVPEYCLSICSADFNDWVWKNASTQGPYSYVWTNEYEIFEFDLGPKFNYAEMATLIAPRPFMVERGHFDGVAPDERVGLEFAKVQRMYAARLGIPERCRIEWFVGPHTIHGIGTFDFLRTHLK